MKKNSNTSQRLWTDFLEKDLDCPKEKTLIVQGGQFKCNIQPYNGILVFERQTLPLTEDRNDEFLFFDKTQIKRTRQQCLDLENNSGDLQKDLWILNETEEVSETSLKLKIGVALPDRPLIVDPPASFCLSPEQKKTFFITIPLWINLSGNITKDSSKPATQKADYTYGPHPTQILSNTWHGDTTDGTLCYKLKTTIDTEKTSKKPRPVTALCPVTFRNACKRPYAFQNFFLQTDFLSVYKSDDLLLTNGVTITSSEPGKTVQTQYLKRSQDVTSVRITPSRKTPENFIQKGFQQLISQKLYE